jgi:hypothetical protein
MFTLKIFSIDLTSQKKDLNLFPHPFYASGYDIKCQPKTLVELAMMHLSGIIRSK